MKNFLKAFIVSGVVAISSLFTFSFAQEVVCEDVDASIPDAMQAYVNKAFVNDWEYLVTKSKEGYDLMIFKIDGITMYVMFTTADIFNAQTHICVTTE